MAEYVTFVVPLETVKPLLTTLNTMLDSDTLTDDLVINQIADFLISNKSDCNKPANLILSSLMADIIYDDYKSEILNIAVSAAKVGLLAAIRGYDNRFTMRMLEKTHTLNHVVVVQTRKENIC